MTQKTSILNFLFEFHGNYRPFEIAEALGIKRSSVNSVISRLRKDGILTKPKKNRTVRVKRNNKTRKLEKSLEITKKPDKKIEKLQYFTKILKTGGSKKDDKKVVASTWEHEENPERFIELKKALMEFMQFNKLQSRDLGYQRKKVLNQPVNIPEFPDIEVHTEF